MRNCAAFLAALSGVPSCSSLLSPSANRRLLHHDPIDLVVNTETYSPLPPSPRHASLSTPEAGPDNPFIDELFPVNMTLALPLRSFPFGVCECHEMIDQSRGGVRPVARSVIRLSPPTR